MSEEIKKDNEVASEEVETTEVVLNPEDIEKEIAKDAEGTKINDVLADVVVDEKSKKIIKTIDIKVGMYVRVYQRIFELNSKGEEKSRLQMFEGLVIAKKHGNTPSSTFMVRKVSKGYIVEKIYPTFLPTLEKIECMKIAVTRKSKMYFVRERKARKMKFIK